MAVIVSDPLQPCFRADIEHKRQAFFLAVDSLDVLLSPPGYPFCVCCRSTSVIARLVMARLLDFIIRVIVTRVMAGHQEKAGLPFLRLPARHPSSPVLSWRGSSIS